MMPSIIDGRASIAKSHCHAFTPPKSCKASRIYPENGAPITLDTGIASMNTLSATAREACGHALQHEIARNLEGGVAEKEYARTQTEDRRGEAEVLVHLQRGKADIHAVEIIGEKTDGEKRQQPPSHFRDRPLAVYAFMR